MQDWPLNSSNLFWRSWMIFSLCMSWTLIRSLLSLRYLASPGSRLTANWFPPRVFDSCCSRIAIFERRFDINVWISRCSNCCLASCLYLMSSSSYLLWVQWFVLSISLTLAQAVGICKLTRFDDFVHHQQHIRFRTHGRSSLHRPWLLWMMHSYRWKVFPARLSYFISFIAQYAKSAK